MLFNLADLYPGFSGYGYDDTTNQANMGKEEQEQLLIDPKTADNADKKSSGKQILIAVCLIACMAVFFGMD